MRGVLVALKSWTRPVLAPTPVSMRRLALAGVIADAVIMSTGAAVRLSASGLGCPDWPQCSAADVVASKNAGQTLLNTWIEFGNRLLNFPLVIIAALIFIAAWRFRPDGPTAPGTGRRRDLVWLGAAQPLGVAVTIEFLGPLAVAVAGSRHLRDVGWVVLAGAGVVLLTQGGHGDLDLAGVLFAGLAAACWAAYIVLSSATGRRFPGSAGLAIAMVVSAVIVTPPALIAGGGAMFRPAVLATGAAIGILSSVIPYRLELESLRRIPMRLFGVWMSLEPAVAALIGLALLGQHLSAVEWLAICCVMAACAGAAQRQARGTPSVTQGNALP